MPCPFTLGLAGRRADQLLRTAFSGDVGARSFNAPCSRKYSQLRGEDIQALLYAPGWNELSRPRVGLPDEFALKDLHLRKSLLHSHFWRAFAVAWLGAGQRRRSAAERFHSCMRTRRRASAIRSAVGESTCESFTCLPSAGGPGAALAPTAGGPHVWFPKELDSSVGENPSPANFGSGLRVRTD